MSEKYYTPKIEEFYVGFEYEAMIADEDYEGHGWMKLVYPKDPFIGESISRKSNMKDLRVKHLDESDIESLGFKYVMTSYDGYYLNKHIEIGYVYDRKRIQIRSKSEGILFIGLIKNKSELKKILKQIGAPYE